MSEPTNDPLTHRQKWMNKHSKIVKFVAVVKIVVLFILALGVAATLLLQKPSLQTHEGCVVQGINVTTDRTGKVYTDIYSQGCTNSKERIAYFDGPVYDNILEYEKAKNAKDDNFIQLHKTYNFTTEVYSVLFQDHERIKDTTLVK